MTFTRRGPLATPLCLMKKGRDETAAWRDISRIFSAFLLNLEDGLDVNHGGNTGRTEATLTTATQTSKCVAHLSMLFGEFAGIA